MEAFGFTPEDYAETVELWPENWPAWCLFVDIQTQWRTSGMGGPSGLDYGPLFKLMEHQGLTGKEWREMFDDIRALESAALDQIGANQ
jgi:hypothetical protein